VLIAWITLPGGLFWSAMRPAGCRAHGELQPPRYVDLPAAGIREKWPSVAKRVLFCIVGLPMARRAALPWSANQSMARGGVRHCRPWTRQYLREAEQRPKRSDQGRLASLGQWKRWRLQLGSHAGDGSTRDQRPLDSRCLLADPWGDAGECLLPFRKRFTGEMLAQFSPRGAGILCARPASGRTLKVSDLGLAVPISGLGLTSEHRFICPGHREFLPRPGR